MKGNFDRCIGIILPHEGGYVHDKRDPGGETNFGISKRSYPSEDIRGMTPARAAGIYRRDFWPVIRGDSLPAGVDLATLDPAINSGPARAARWLQLAAGLRGRDVDGSIGPRTLAAVGRVKPDLAVIGICAARMGFLRGLKTWGAFGRGWSRRVADIEAKAVSMALAAMTPEARRAQVETEAVEADRRRRADTGKAGGAGAGAGGSAVLPDIPDWAMWLAIGLLIVIAVNFLGRARHERARATSFMKAAAEITE